MNKTLKIVIYIIVLGLCLLGGWYIGGKFADKEDSVNTSSNTNTNTDTNNSTEETTKKNDNNKVYQGWISYILNSDIKSIIYNNNIIEEINGEYKSRNEIVEFTKDDLVEIFDSMNNSTIGLVDGIGGPGGVIIEIVYTKSGKDYKVTITQGGIIGSNDEDYINILRNEVKSIYNSMSDEEKKLYSENPVGNIIKNWDSSILKEYYNKYKDKVKVVN